jgi:hypothetical protein
MTTAQKISTLWIVIMFNIVFADILGFMSPGFLTKVQFGVIDGVTITPFFLLIAAVLLQIPILMIFLTRVLPRNPARIINYVAVVITAVFVVGGGSTLPHYLFFLSIELVAMLYIAVLTYRWPDDAGWH